ncbi:glycosyltransferase family 4 protein [Rossellomorea marisflavi]|uniref:glycosyltransferase family 4 protein n=1 Tax=Rossellomorea marisflavi TaxID=189381 RepID=UPI002042517C|nr:glycosyltransferase family 4 protein [Rossellomorea marisflavi]MCM2604247.1 glycosyltransferase family 4 protein [Rossellomorea marisflavi]
MKENINILLMCDNGLETVGGEQESTKIIIRGVKDAFTVGVVQPGLLKKSNLDVKFYKLTTATRIKHLVKRPLSFLNYIRNVRKIINRENPEVIHTQAQVSFFIVALLLKTRLISSNVKFVHTERGLYTKYNAFFKKLFRFFILELDVLVTTTEFNMKYWIKATSKQGKAPAYKIIENTAGELFESYNNALEKPISSKIVVGFAGRYCDWKNWPLALEISRKLNEMLGENLEVEMAVGCLDEKSEVETRNMFNELKGFLGDRFNGQINIDIEAMDNFYYGLDIFILTSNYNTESFGRTLVEAMSRKTIVLTTNAGGSVEVVGEDGNVCENTDEFVHKVNELYKNKSKMIDEKEKNFKRVKDVYSLNNNISKHTKLYSSLVKR